MKIAYHLTALYPLLWLAATAKSQAAAGAVSASSSSSSEPDEQQQGSTPHLRRADPLASASADIIVNSPSEEDETEEEDDDNNNNFPAESSCNRASSLEECRTLSDDDTSQPCQWCVAGAIPSECMSPQQASMLPSGVFECSTPGSGSNNKNKNNKKNANVLEFGPVTVQVRSQQVTEADFCDGSSKQISGYMDLKGSKYDENGEDKHLFFWMFEKRGSSPQENNNNNKEEPVSDPDIPFVVWLTGGPGCSSTLALLTENGPCTVNDDGKTTTVNPHVLWLDQPAGVGYSYGADDDSNEDMVAEDAYWFLQAFFKTYPQYATNPLYIIGESYAGACWVND
jgi:Serine carboxypeptidase